MAYNDDAVLAKLSSLSETQDSIVSVAQWIMFYRRHADRTAQLWLQKLKDSSSHKRLSLIYLANEVAQQSKARRKEEFLVSFSPAVAEAVAVAYKGAPHDVQQRIRRVVDVWRDRGVFEVPIQQAVEARIDDLDKARGSTKAGLGGSIFGSASSSIPAELQPLVAPQQKATKVAAATKPAISSANTDYDGLMTPGSTVPSAPVYAARLSGLLKTLAQAEGAVEQSVQARRELVDQLQKLLDTNRNALIADENELENVMQKRLKVEDKKEEVERAIMAGLPNDEPYPTGNSADDQPSAEPDRPEVEALTPLSNEEEEEFEPEPNSAPEWSPEFPPEDTDASRIVPTMQTIPSIGSPSKSVEVSANGAKKRRLEDTSDFPDLGGDGIDADVTEMLRQDSNSH